MRPLASVAGDERLGVSFHPLESPPSDMTNGFSPLFVAIIALQEGFWLIPPANTMMIWAELPTYLSAREREARGRVLHQNCLHVYQVADPSAARMGLDHSSR